MCGPTPSLPRCGSRSFMGPTVLDSPSNSVGPAGSTMTSRPPRANPSVAPSLALEQAPTDLRRKQMRLGSDLKRSACACGPCAAKQGTEQQPSACTLIRQARPPRCAPGDPLVRPLSKGGIEPVASRNGQRRPCLSRRVHRTLPWTTTIQLNLFNHHSGYGPRV